MKKGFTLIEVIAVIALIGIIIAIVYPIMDNVLSKNTTKLYNDQISSLEHYTENYFNANLASYNISTDFSVCISIDTLYNAGYITSNQITDPRNNSILTGSVKVTYNSINSRATYVYQENCSV